MPAESRPASAGSTFRAPVRRDGGTRSPTGCPTRRSGRRRCLGSPEKTNRKRWASAAGSLLLQLLRDDRAAGRHGAPSSLLEQPTVGPRTLARMIEAQRTTGCLTCGNDRGRFESEEHVLPSALGNSRRSGLVEREIVIPRGEVCDKCNGQRLSRNDTALVEWPPVSLFRSLGLFENRRGGLVDAVPGTAWRFEHDERNRRSFCLHATADTSSNSRRDDVARSLCKIALETQWLQDPLDARSSRWDPISAAAIGGPLPVNLAMGLTRPAAPHEVDLSPDTDITVTRREEPLRLGALIWLAALRFSLLIDVQPIPLPRTAWWTLDRNSGKLVGPDQMWASFQGRADTATKLTEEPASTSPRHRVVLPSHNHAHLQITPAK